MQSMVAFLAVFLVAFLAIFLAAFLAIFLAYGTGWESQVALWWTQASSPGEARQNRVCRTERGKAGRQSSPGLQSTHG